MSTPSRLSARQLLRKPQPPRMSSYVVCAGSVEVWRGQAASILRAFDAARAARPDLASTDLNVTSELESV